MQKRGEKPFNRIPSGNAYQNLINNLRSVFRFRFQTIKNESMGEVLKMEEMEI